MFVVGFVIVVKYLSNKTFLNQIYLSFTSFIPWRRLFTFGINSSFLEMTGMTRLVIMNLETLLFLDKSAVRAPQQPQLLDSWSQLGLLLFFLNSIMKIKHLCLLFGIPPSIASRTVNKMLERVIHYLQFHDHSKIKFPNHAEKVHFATLVQRRKPTIHNVIGFVDGLSIFVECS